MTPDRRTTVLHLIHTPGAGGAETVLLQLVENLDPSRYRSVAAVPEGSWLQEALSGTPATVVPTPPGRPFDLPLLRRLARTVRAEGVELIHSHLFGPAVYGGMLSLALGPPLVATIHGGVDLAEAHRWWGAKKRMIRRSGARVVAVTDALRDEVVRELGMAPDRVGVIRNGIDTDRFAPGAGGGLREELGWGGDQIVIGALGNVRRPKDYANLLRAADRLRRGCPRCRFVVVGDTEGEPTLTAELLDLRGSLGLERHVVFAGFRGDVPAVLNDLDIYVMSSSREGLPLALLQAMATGLPVVATRCGGPDELLTDGRDGRLVPPRDPGALAQALEALVNDPEARDRLGRAARATVENRHAITRMTADYEATYRTALAGKGAGGTGGEP